MAGLLLGWWGADALVVLALLLLGGLWLATLPLRDVAHTLAEACP